jgi:histidinol-phosphatase (PHP family)
MYLCNTHTHTQVSFDSKATLRAMAEAAIAAGFNELCVTDHCDLLDGAGTLNDHFDWPAAKAQYHETLTLVEGQLTLRLGIELGSIVYRPDLARQILAEGGDEVDFVLGSIHNWIGLYNNRDLYYTDYTNNPALCREAMQNALENTLRMVTECPDCYDSLAHISYPPRYMHRDGQSFTLAPYEEQIRQIFIAIARTDHALEVNTWRGLDVEGWKPLLRWYRECGGKYVTLGSDAHTPEDMAKGIREVIPLLQAVGFDHVTTYEKRRPVLHKL